MLAPLPVHNRTLFLAKVAAVATALSVTVLALNGLASLLWPLALAPPTTGILDLFLTPEIYRTFVAYWVTVLAAGGFIFGSLLCLQGLAAQLLSRPLYLRVSALLQMAAFGVLISVYFLQPYLTTPAALANPANQRLLAWLPSYWFLGLFQQLNGSSHPALAPLARRAWLGSAIVVGGTIVVYLLSYFRTLRKIVEQPDIVPVSRASWLPRFGDSFQTAITQFSIRTLLRSRQHRMILAFYLGVGFAITILFVKTPAARQLYSGNPWHQVNPALLASSIVITIAWIVGARVVFSMPLDLRANWTFRITPLCGGCDCLNARRRVLVVLALAPVWICSLALFLSIWPVRPASMHLAILGLAGIVVAELCLLGAQKIPFTCSWLPGRSNFHLTFWLCIGVLMTIISKGAQFEQQAIEDPRLAAVVLLVLGIAALSVRWWTTARAKSPEGSLQFEDTPEPAILGLGLNRDGAWPT